jgi:sec-independent protein translocase protein TatC
MGSALYYSVDIFQWLTVPAGDALSPFGGKPTITTPGGMVSQTIWLGVKAGVLTAVPAIWIRILLDMRSWMPSHFWWKLVGFTTASVISLLAGLSFVYFVMMPFGLKFLLNFGSDIVVSLITLPAYMGLVTSMGFSVGMFFQIPLLMFMVTNVGLVGYPRFRRLRKFWIPTALIFGALLSPGTDLVNAALLIVPLILLYEIGMFVVFIAKPADGNYLWIKTIWGAVFWVVSRPNVAWRKVERFLVKHGVIGW